jgi:hypothetical protein
LRQDRFMRLRPLVTSLREEVELSIPVGDLDNRLREAAEEEFGYTVEELDWIGDNPVTLLLPPASDHKLLVMAGFRGDDPAATFAILKRLETVQRTAWPVMPAFLPLAAPGRVRVGERLLREARDPDGGFCRVQGKGTGKTRLLSKEGVVFAKTWRSLREAGRDGFLSFHEKADGTSFPKLTETVAPPECSLEWKLVSEGLSGYTLQLPGAQPIEARVNHAMSIIRTFLASSVCC